MAGDPKKILSEAKDALRDAYFRPIPKAALMGLVTRLTRALGPRVRDLRFTPKRIAEWLRQAAPDGANICVSRDEFYTIGGTGKTRRGHKYSVMVFEPRRPGETTGRIWLKWDGANFHRDCYRPLMAKSHQYHGGPIIHDGEEA